MIEVQVAVDIARPSREVFAYLADMGNNPVWQKGMVSCEWTSEVPIAVGSTYDQRARFLGRDIITSFEVSEYEPGRHIRILSTESTMPLDIARTVDPDGDGACRVTAVIRGEPQGWQAALAPLMKRVVARSVNGDYGRLKELLEKGPP